MRSVILVIILLASLFPALATATTITLWTSEIHEDRLAVIQYLANVFSVLSGETDIKVVSVDENDLVAHIAGTSEPASRPTLVSTGSELIGALGEKGLLDKTLAQECITAIGKDRFYAGALRQFSAPGQRTYYGIPYHGWVQGIWYRADWFDKAKLAPPTTWDAILKAADHFNDPETNTYGILVGTEDVQYTEQVFTQIALSNGAMMFDAAGKLRFNSPAMLEALEYYLKLAAFTPPGPQTWRARDYYLQGHMAMFFYSTFIMDDLALKGVAENSLTGEHFPQLSGARFDPELALNTRLAPLITHKHTSSYGMINGFGILKTNTEEENQAVSAFLKFLYAPGPYVEWLHMAPGGMLPVLRDIAESEDFMRDPLGVFRRYGRPKIREILSGLEGIENFGTVEGHRFPQASVFYTERIIPRMITKALAGDMTPRQAVAWAESEMQKLLSAP